MVFTTRFSGGKGGRNGLENELRRLGVTAEERPPEPPADPGQSRAVPADPEEMARPPRPPARRPHRPAGPARRLHQPLQPAAGRTAPCRTATPAAAYAARPKAAPGDRAADTHDRVRTDIIGNTGTVTLRHQRPALPHRRRPDPRRNPHHHAHPGPRRPHHRRRHRRTPARTHPRPQTATTSPPAGHPDPRQEPRANANTPNPDVGSGCPRCLETSHWRAWQDSNLRPAA